MTAPAPRAVGYSRVSTPDQTTETQTARLRAAAGQMGLDLSEDGVLVDDGVSGRVMSRPAFDRVRELVRSRSIDVVLTTKFDRLGRSARGVLEFFELAESSGVRVVCVDQAVDTATPLGKFMRTIAAGFAELEADMNAERTSDRLTYLIEQHRKTGVWETRSGDPLGRRPIVTPSLVAQITALREERKLEWAAIARTVHHPSSSCRKWYSAARAGKLRVINPSPGFGAPSAAPEQVPRAEGTGSEHDTSGGRP